MIKKIKAYNRIIIIIFIILSFFVILLNKGQLNYSVWKPAFIIEYTDESQLEKLKNLDNIAQINTEDKQLNLQNTSYEKIIEKIKSMDEKLVKEVEISYIESRQFNQDFQQILFFIILSIFFYICGTYYFVYRFINKDSLRKLVINIVNIILSSILGILYLFAIMLVLSHFYLIKQIDLTILTLFIILLLFFNFYVNSKSIKNSEIDPVKSLIFNQIKVYKDILRYLIILITAIFALITFALGKNFVILGVLIILAAYFALALQSFTLSSVYHFLHRKEVRENSTTEPQKLTKTTKKYINKGPKRKSVKASNKRS